MFDLRKQLEDKLQLAPATALTKAKTVSVAPARTVNTSNFVVKQPTIKMAQPKQPTLQIQQTPVRQNFPVAQQNSPTQKSLQIGTPKTIRLTARPRVRTIEEIRMEPLFKQGKSFEDIQQQAGFSSREVKDYADKYHQNYGDKGLVQNVARETGKFVGGMVKAGAGIVTRPIHDASDLNRKKGEAELQQINRDYRSGVISPEAAMERAQTLASKYTTQKAYQDKDGWIRVGTHNPVEFAGNIAQQGIDTYSVLPTSGAVTTAGARAAGKAGMTKTTGLLSKASEFMTGGAGVINQGSRLAPQANKLAQGLTKVGMNSGLADDVSKAVVSNAVQSGVYGTAQTGADIASGRGVSPESLLMNYGADFVMGTGMELGTGALLRSGAKAIDSVPTAKKMADSHPQILGMLAETDKLFEQKNALLSRGMSPNSAAVVGVNKAIKAAGAEYNRVYKQVYDAAKLEMQRGFIAGPLAGDFSKAKAAGQVFNGVDGKPRFEVDDSGAKIKNPNGNTLGDVLDHPELYKNYPELKSTRVSHIEGKDSSFGGSEIRLGKQATDKQGSLLHETQHAIQDKEKFASGGGPEAKDFNLNDYTNTPAGKAHLAENVRLAKDKDPSLTDIQAKNLAGHKTRQEATYSQYRNLAGEAEARAVQARMNMPMSERYVKPDPIVNPKTGETLSQSVKKLEGYGWSKADIEKYKKTVLGGNTKMVAPKGALDSLNPTGGLFVDYTPAQRAKAPLADNMTTLDKTLGGKPDDIVTIYRGAPKSQKGIVAGDFVTLDKQVAQSYVGDGHVIAKKVRKGDLLDEIDSPSKGDETLYRPNADKEVRVARKSIATKEVPKPRSTFYDSLDVPKEDLIIRNEGGKAMSIDDPTAALKQEALKYKSAEEHLAALHKQAYGVNEPVNIPAVEQTIKDIPNKVQYAQEDAAKQAQDLANLKQQLAEAQAAHLQPTGRTTLDGKPQLNDTSKIQKSLKRQISKQEKSAERYNAQAKLYQAVANKSDLYNQAHTQPTPKVEAPQVSKTEFIPSNGLARKKHRLENEIEALNNRLSNQNDMPGAYVTGRAGISNARQKKQYASLERTIDDSKRLNKAIDELKATNDSIERQRRNALKPKVEKKQTVVTDASKIKVSESDSLMLDDYGFNGDKKTQLAKYVKYLDGGGEPHKGLERINGQYSQTKNQLGVHDSLADDLPNQTGNTPIITKSSPKPTLQDAPDTTPKPEAPQPTVAPVRKPKTAFEKSLEQAGLAPSQPLASKPKGKIATDVSASAPVSRKVSESTAIQSSKKESRPSQKVQMSRTRQETQGRPSQRQGRETPSPDSKVLTDRTFSDNTPPIDTKQYIKELSKEQSVAGKGKFSAGEKAADFKEKFIDDLSPIEDRLNKAIKAGAEVDPKDHITYQLDRSRRSEGVTQAYMNDNDLSKIIQEVPNPKEFDQYLIARHAKELDPKITTGRNKAKDAALVKQLEGKYGEYAKRVYAYNQKLLDTSVEYGLISKELAASLKKQYPEYVPLNRIFKEDELGMLQGNGKGNASISTQGVVKKLVGSKRSVRSPLNSIIDKTRVVIEQGERNKAAQMLASYKDLPDNPFNLKEIKANETIGNRNTIAYLDNGKKRVFEVDKEIADAAKNMNRQYIGLWGRIAAVPARVLRAGATTANIGFAGANVVRDVIGAAINSKHPIRIADPEAFGKALAAALNHNGKYYQELMREGVAGTSFDMYRNPLKSNIGEIRSQKNIGTRSLYNVTHPKQWYRTLENSIGRSEDFGRALQYYSNKSGFIAEGKNAGDAKILAADQARNNSTNFFRHGSYGKGINLAIPYWNAGVQGARIQTRRIIERPVQTIAKMGLVIAAPSAMIAVNNYSDENKRKVMEDIEDYEKEGNIIIVGNDAKFNEKTGRWDGVYKIPVPPQHIGLHNIVQDAVKSAYTGAEYDFMDNLGKVAENYTTVDPTDARGIVNKYTPQGVKLIAEPMANTNFFTGKPIVPDYQKNLPAADQYDNYTSGTAKVIGRATNTSPKMIDNAIRTGTGGAGKSVVKAIDDVASADTQSAKVGAGANALVLDPITKRFSGAQAVSPTTKAEKQFGQLKKQVTESDAYKNASQYDKSRMLNRLQGDLEDVAWNATGKSETKLTKKQKDLSENGFKLDTYTNLDSSAKNSKSDTGWMDEYNAAKSAYSKESKDWTEIQRIGKEKELRTLEVKKNFSKDATRLYDMSERDIYAYLDRSDDKKASDYLNQIVAYGDKMVEAGLWSTNKLRDKYGNVQYKRGYTGSTGGGRSTSRSSSTRSSGSTAKKGKFDYKLYGFSSSPSGSGSAKDLYDLLKRATMKG